MYNVAIAYLQGRAIDKNGNPFFPNPLFIKFILMITFQDNHDFEENKNNISAAMRISWLT